MTDDTRTSDTDAAMVRLMFMVAKFIGGPANDDLATVAAALSEAERKCEAMRLVTAAAQRYVAAMFDPDASTYGEFVALQAALATLDNDSKEG